LRAGGWPASVSTAGQAISRSETSPWSKHCSRIC
jgi:hypothetical protein